MGALILSCLHHNLLHWIKNCLLQVSRISIFFILRKDMDGWAQISPIHLIRYRLFLRLMLIKPSDSINNYFLFQTNGPLLSFSCDTRPAQSEAKCQPPVILFGILFVTLKW